MGIESSNVTRLELQLVATMAALTQEDPDGVFRIHRAYHAFISSAGQGIPEFVVEPLEMAELDLPPARDEFEGEDYTVPRRSSRARIVH